MTARSQSTSHPHRLHQCPECGGSVPCEPKTEWRENEFRVIPPHGADDRGATYPSYQAPSKYMRVVELLFSHPDTPWRTASDVYRAFLDDGCRKYGSVIGGKVITGILHRLDMMNRLVEQAREANDFAMSIDSLDRESQRMVDGGMREAAVGLVYQYREEARKMPDRILRRKLVADINQRFAYLLKGSQGRKEHEGGGTKIEVDTEGEEEHGQHGDE